MLTDQWGHPIYDNQNQRTVGARGPATLEYYHLIEKISHFDLSQCDRPIQERMVWHLLLCDDELGLRVGEGLGIKPDDAIGLPPLATRTLTEDELARAANLGKNGPRDVTGLTMTHCAPNEHVALAWRFLTCRQRE